MKHLLAASLCLLLFTSASWSQDSQNLQAPKDNASTQDTITVPKAEFDDLKARVEKLEQELELLKAGQAPAQTAEPAEPVPATAPEPETQAASAGKALALPDISLVVQSIGKASTDEKDPDRNRLLLTEAELGIQGYVYPNVKADAFFTASPAEDEPFGVEEAYLTYQGLLPGLNFNVGKKHVAFGRTNLLHSHSWLYPRQPYVIGNLVSHESLTGQGAAISYLLPTHSDLFAQLDLGTWSYGDEGEPTELIDFPNFPEFGTGANLTNRFSTARLWTGYPITENSELEIGGSYAGGTSLPEPFVGEDRVHIKGVDLTFRHYGEGSSRLLLRGEGFWRRGTLDSDGATADGYYLFGNYRPNNYGSLGVLYDWSEFPQAVGLHESAISLILTHQFSEQYYLRLMGTHGSRPDDHSFNELWLQWVWGVGPHTHNLE